VRADESPQFLLIWNDGQGSGFGFVASLRTSRSRPPLDWPDANLDSG
jgi:hypothetical protein